MWHRLLKMRTSRLEPMVSHVSSPMRQCVRYLLLIQLFAIALFVAGPQMGSIDDDQDGIPDIEVVVSAPQPGAFSGLRWNERLPEAFPPAVVKLRRMGGSLLRLDRTEFSPTASHSALCYLCMLRC